MQPLIINTLEQFWLSGVVELRVHGLLLAEAAMELPTEVVVIIGTVVSAFIAGVTYVGRWAFSQSEKRIEAAERRELEEKASRKEDRDTHNKHLDAATQGITMLTRTVQEQTTMMKSAQDGHREELRRVSDGITQIRAALHRDQA